MSEIDVWKDLHAKIVAWAEFKPESKNIADGVLLLAALRALPPLRGEPPPEVALMRRLQRSKDVKIGNERYDASQAPILQLIATDSDVAWPWFAPAPSEPAGLDSGGQAEFRRQLVKRLYGMSAQESKERSRALAHVAAIVARVDSPAGIAASHWLESAFRLRVRDMWVPSAVEQACLVVDPASGGATIAHLCERLESAASALLLPKRKGRSAGAGAAGQEHLGRHVRVAATLATVLAGDSAVPGRFAGGDADMWLNSASEEYDTLSALVGALVELAAARPDSASRCHALAADALRRIRTKFSIVVNYQAWEAARALVDADCAAETMREAMSLLMEVAAPHADRPASLSAGDIYDAGTTLKWMLRRGEAETSVARLRAGRLAGQVGVEHAARGDFASWGDRVAHALRALAPERREGLPRSERLSALVELAWLVEWPEARTLSWAHVVRGADASWLQPTEGEVHLVALADIFTIARDLDALFAQLLHQRPLDAARPDGTLPTTGLERLLRARWLKRSSVGGKVGVWKVHQHLSAQAGNHVVSRLVSCENEDAVARILLSVLSADSPPDDARSALSGVEKDSFWEYVLTWWPNFEDGATGSPSHPLLDPLVRWEKERSSTDIKEVLLRGEVLFRDLAVALPTLQPVCAPISRVAMLGEVAWNERPQGTGSADWRVGARSASEPGAQVASPAAMGLWCKEKIVPLAEAVAKASYAIVAITGEKFVAEHQLEKVRRLCKETTHEVDMPLVDVDTAAEWRAALQGLRTLAEPLPWHVEGAVDALAGAVEDWIAAGEANRLRRNQVVEDLHTAMSDGNEKEVLRLTLVERLLLGKLEVGRVGRYFLRRLRFDEASRLRAYCEDVPTSYQYYAPLLLGVAGAPLSSIQTDKIWEPLLQEAHDCHFLKYAFVVLPMLLISLYLLYADVKLRAPNLHFQEIVRRGATPLLLLLTVNYGGNWIIWWAVAKDAALTAGPYATTAMWGTLSLFLGIFLGLIAQGRGMAQE
jgi:hypothetical protein